MRVRVSSVPVKNEILNTVHLIIILQILLLLNANYSPWTFNNANPNERPSNVMKKHTTDVVTISALAYGKIFKTSSIMSKSIKFLLKLNI